MVTDPSSGVWRSPASLRPIYEVVVEHATGPCVAIDDQGTVLDANEFFGAIVGRRREWILGRSLLGELVAADCATEFTDALPSLLAGSASPLATSFETARGSRVELTFDPMTFVDRGRAIVVLTVQSARVLRDAIDSTAFAAYAYEVRLREGSLEVAEGTGPASPCHERYGNDKALCAKCPARTALDEQRSSTAVIADRNLVGHFLLLRATPLDRERVEIERVALDTKSLTAALRAKIDGLAVECGLSPRERDVLDLLLLGRTLDDVSIVLGISRYTAKFHQTNIIDKLGADSRFDLIRVLL